MCVVGDNGFWFVFVVDLRFAFSVLLIVLCWLPLREVYCDFLCEFGVVILVVDCVISCVLASWA